MRKILVLAGLAATLAFTLFYSYELKSPCLEKPWGAPQMLEYRNLCYNDIQGLYGVRKLDQRAFPYVVEKSYEYPVLMGVSMWATSLFAHDHVQYFKATVPFLSLMAILSLMGLVGAIGARRQVLWFAAGTPLLFYAYLNWDLIPVACVCLAMWAWSRRQIAATGAAIGLGVAAKIYPGFLLPSLMIGLWTEKNDERRVRDVQVLVGACAAAWFAVNLPIIVAEYLSSGSITGWISVFTFHAKRGADFGSIWYLFNWLATDDAVPTYLAMLFPVMMGWLTVWAATRKSLRSYRLPLVAACGFVTLVLSYFLFAVQSHLGPDDFRTLVDHVSESSFALGALALWYGQWKRGSATWTTGGGVIALYLGVSKIHSPQHALWVLPLMIVTNVPSSTLLGYLTGDALVFLGGFTWFATSLDMQTNAWKCVFMVGVFVRAAFLLRFAAQCGLGATDRFQLRARKFSQEELGHGKTAETARKVAA